MVQEYQLIAVTGESNTEQHCVMRRAVYAAIGPAMYTFHNRTTSNRKKLLHKKYFQTPSGLGDCVVEYIFENQIFPTT